MLQRKPSFIQVASFLTGGLILLLAFYMPANVYADGPTPPDNGTCISCHEDLYFLHDTGNWFCLEESPMTCVQCHGGDSNTLVKEEAHTNRAPHPVFNEDISKCQECHPDQCDERVEIFGQNAGIDNVFVAAPYTPDDSYIAAESVPVTGKRAEETHPWLNILEIIAIALIVIAALVFYFVHIRRQAGKMKA